MNHYTKSILAVAIIGVAATCAAAGAGETPAKSSGGAGQLGNRPERLKWFEDLGFGLFIHWSLDSQLGSVISHSLVDADEAYCRRFFNDLPKSFHPRDFDPQRWAELAKLAGVKYVVFTAKHHSGFCMYDTKTTDFDIMATPLGRDVTREILEAFRKQGIATGLYFSPDDFWFLWKQGTPISRRRPGVTPQENPALMKYDRAQLRELLTNYGPIDVMFIDGPAEGLRELCWELQPNIVVTRGAMVTPEQHVPGQAIPGPWEACMTMGTQWQYKPTNEENKSGTQLIETLIETRSKGGNFLLNIGPHPDGTIPVEQEQRLREMGLWNFINGEAIFGTKPWRITNEENIFFTQTPDGQTVYAIVTSPDWKWGTRKEFVLKSVRAGDDTRVNIVGQNSKILEYQPDADPVLRWEQKEDGLHISAVRSHRIYNDRRWPNPIVFRIENAKSGPLPPQIRTLSVTATGSGTAEMKGEVTLSTSAQQAEAYFQFRTNDDPTNLLARVGPWRDTAKQTVKSSGELTVVVGDLAPGTSYESRAVVQDQMYTVYGETQPLRMP